MNGVLRLFGRIQSARRTNDSKIIARHAPPRPAGLQAEVLRDWPRVAQLAPEWNALLSGSRADTIFLTWEWIDAWAKVVGHKYQPLVVAVRDAAGSLCGLAPLYVEACSLVGAVRWKLLRVMGDRLTGAEYADWIVRCDCERVATLAILGALSEHRRHWDCLWMKQMSGWSGACERVGGTSAAMGLYVNSRLLEFSQVDLPATLAAYDEMLGDSRLRKFRWQKNKIMRSGKVSITRCTSHAELPGYLDALMQLHTARRSLLGDDGTFLSRPEEAKFYREFAPRALDLGWLSVWALRDGPAFKAVQCGYVYNDIFYSMQEGFDPGYLPGAGNMLRLAVIRHCIESGIRHYDFLGGYTEHKSRWGAKLRHGQDLFIGRPGLANRVIFLANVWPTGRYLRPVCLPGVSP